MGRDRAAYMREYRARKERAKRRVADLATLPPMPMDQERLLTIEEFIWVQDQSEAKDKRIAELEEEVRHLKAELAKRPIPDIRPFNSRPFTPVPKK